jgi:SAM-dependent methyltransferase
VLVKDHCPQAYVITSDVVTDCVKHCGRYEKLLARCVDEKWAFSVRDMPFADGQFDRIFTFAAFHHFGDHGDYTQVLAEISRCLKRGGKLVLLYEPTSPAYLYPLAYRRVNKNRAHDGVDEDVLVESKLRRIADKLGLTVRWMFYPNHRYRSSVAASLYYFLVSKLGTSKYMVCTANIVFEKQ